MKLEMLKMANTKSLISGVDKSIEKVIVESLGESSLESFFENKQITSNDYEQWLDIVKGYAQANSISLSKKRDFVDIAKATLANENIDSNLLESVTNKLWLDYKSKKQLDKINKIANKAKEDEQFSHALDRFRNPKEKEDKMAGFAPDISDDEADNYHIDWSDGSDYEDEQFFDRFRKQPQSDPMDNFAPDLSDEDDYEPNWSDSDDLDFEDEEFFSDSDESDDWNIEQERQERQERLEDDYEQDYSDDQDQDLDDRMSNQSKYDEDDFEDEESSYQKGQVVTYKKDNKQYKISIADGPGDTVGLMINGIIKYIPISQICCDMNSEDEEKHNDKSTSLLHDLMSGGQSKANILKLQKEIQQKGYNDYAIFYAQMPRNPHEKGSYAWSAYEKGLKSAATEIWAPKKIEVDPKKKPTKKK